jgi:pyruvate-ferredoxin/flavodoxin oxidoreductase
MPEPTYRTMDGNEAVADVAFRLNEVVAIYPITPSSNMGEWSDAWSADARPNVWGVVPTVIEMQSEGGAAGCVHGALQAGSLTTTFTSSQGLLLMIPNMYKIAGELTPAVIHVAARALAAQALSIFGDHSDVMATRATGFAMLCSGSVQEAMDMAAIAQAATLATRIPFVHFFDGFRTSHEESKVETLTDEQLRAMIDDRLVMEHRARALSPDHPVLRGTAQNPDVYFQARETVNPFYQACPDAVERAMERFAEVAGRRYHLYEYHGAPDAERVVVIMGSGAEAAHETVDHLMARGEKVGILKVRLFRPFDVERFVAALPPTTRAVAVLDRTKEPGASGEPLYLDCVTAFHEAAATGRAVPPVVVGGRYGLSSKEFTPAMVKAVFDNLTAERPRNHFTVGIHDDVSHTSLDYDAGFSIEAPSVVRAIFYGLGADGTVGANKNSIKIIGERTANYAQGYFVYDSKKSGAVTVSHLRFGPEPIRSSYLITEANFVACHQPVFLERYDMLRYAAPGATFLLNTAHGPDEVWETLPRRVREDVVAKRLKLYVIDAYRVARAAGMGGRINTVMQVCFFAISGVLPREEAIEAIKRSIVETYGRKGDEIVRMNLAAVDQTLDHLHEVAVPAETNGGGLELPPLISPEAPPFVRDVLGEIVAGRGDALPVSALPCDGTFPTGTSMWEKRNIAQELPVWDPAVCIQCNKCTLVCPHGVLRVKVFDPAVAESAPESFKSYPAKEKEWKGLAYSIQVAPEDCTGCAICVDVCPAKNKSELRLKALNMEPQAPLREAEAANWDFFLTIADRDRRELKVSSIRQQQLQLPLFEFSGACSGCGETPYVKLVSQLFGDRALVANATGCSSIYGGNLPTTPWTKNADGRGPAWSNSLFEDNAEFGLGMRLSIDKQRETAAHLLRGLASHAGDELVEALLADEDRSEAGIYEQRERVALLRERLAGVQTPEAARLAQLADYLVRKSVWIVGGDGWAYDIGYGGLDHVLSTGADVNILVLDTEVYSNTGGQMSKATPRGAVAKFAAGGRPGPKKDLGLIAMTSGNTYVASVAMGAKDEHTLKAFLEAEAFHGPSLIIAYSHCIAHGIDMARGMQNQKAAVESGQWLLYRFNPDRAAAGENPLVLDSRAPKIPVADYMNMETRFRMLAKAKPDTARRLFAEAQEDATARFKLYEYLAARPGTAVPAAGEAPAATKEAL